MGYPTGQAPRKREWVALPARPFMYTADQLAAVLSMTEAHVRGRLLWYEGREVGVRPLVKLKAINIANEDERPDWRVSEQELIRWMKHKGFRYYERAWAE